MATNVTLLLKGSLVLFAQEGQITGSVRILKDPPPNHALSLDYQTQPPAGSFGQPIPVTPIRDDLQISVTNPINGNITLNNTPIDRTDTSTNPDSFRWIVDLENDELYDTPIGFKKSAFKQVLTFNSGKLFNDTSSSDNPSYNILYKQEGVNKNYEEFGFVGIRIRIEFSTNDKVVFKNANDVVFDSSTFAAGTNFKINLVNDATSHPPICTDANHYYKGVGAGIPPEEKKLFLSIKEDDTLRAMLKAAELRGDKHRADRLRRVELEPPAGPEAACFPAYLSKTNP